MENIENNKSPNQTPKKHLPKSPKTKRPSLSLTKKIPKVNPEPKEKVTRKNIRNFRRKRKFTFSMSQFKPQF